MNKNAENDKEKKNRISTVANRNNNNNGDAGGEASRRNPSNGGEGGDWNQEEDRFSFDDSDRFEEDSLCSWDSEESLCNNWRGWKKPSASCGLGNGINNSVSSFIRRDEEDSDVSSLTELAAKCVASYIPFELVEHFYPPVPEQLQLRIAFWSFPDNEEDIRLYSCLANSSAEEFNRGDQLYKTRAVKDPLQIGFHLSATVVCQAQRAHFNVAVTFDRRRISSCNCTCTSSAYWCSHVVAVCLHRIHCPLEVCLRAPVSESLTRLQRDQLQKFAQYLISELPQQILPTAQRLLDELLSAQPTAINTVCGAPDPTAGASINDQTSWYLDEKTLHANIKRILVKFCLPAPIVFSDVNYLTNSAPPAAAEWSSLLRPLRGREPEGMWNLLSIVREMYRRCDRNAVRLLEIITEECMACDQILIWWFQTKLSLMMGSHGHNGGKHSNTHSNTTALQHACSSLCDEIVVLWRLAALNPGLAPDERDMLHAQFTAWHLKILDRVVKCRMMPSSYSNKHQQNSRTDAEIFVGFKPAIEACYLDWEEYPIVGITHTHDTNPIYYSPFTCFKHTDSKGDSYGNGGQLNATQAVMANNKHYNYYSTSTDHGGGVAFKQRYDRPFRDRFYISSSNHSSNSSSDSVHGRLHQGFGVAAGNSNNGGGVVTEKRVLGTNMETSAAIAVSSANFVCLDLNVGNQAGGVLGPIVLPVPIPDEGNGSSASSEGFCENEDFGGDSSSNLCIEAADGGQSLAPLLNSTNVKNIAAEIVSSDSQGSFDASSPSVIEETCTETAFKLPISCAQSITTQKATETISYSSSTTNSSTSLILAATGTTKGSQNTTPVNVGKSENVAKFISKEDYFSSSDEIGCVNDVVVPANSANDTLTTCQPSTSAAAARAAQTNFQKSNSLENVTKQTASIATNNTSNNLLQGPSTSSAAAAAMIAATNVVDTTTTEKPHIFSNVRPSEDAWDILLARSEGLHAHGHGREACILAVRLAEEMLANPPNLMIELPPLPKRKGKNKNIVNPISHHLTVLASSTLSKCAFLCTVLSENSEHYHIAFRICLFALEMPRPPASTKPLEVKLANQEADILALLKKIPLNEPELRVIRERAELLRNGSFKTRGEALLPINLATFIFDALVMPLVTIKEQRNRIMNMMYRTPADENLGFEAAVAALGLKTNVSEAEHPLLCEGTRRQRGELALSLLYYYKDEPLKIAKIMEKLLDRDIHVLLKTPLLPAYYSNNPPVRTAITSVSATRMRGEMDLNGGNGGGAMHACASMNEMMQLTANDHSSVGGNSRPHSSTSAELDIMGGMSAISISSSTQGGCGSSGVNGTASSSSMSSVANGQNLNNTGGGGGMLTMTQAPQTGGGGGGAGAGIANNSNNNNNNVTSSRSKESGRYAKGKRAYPSIPNQPSEASAHFMFELAKNVLNKAGGNSSTSLFTQATTNQNHHGPQRALHMCAFQLGLFALGLHNCVSPNWLSRTYSSHVSWIIGQAMEIGAPAISFLIDTWEGHLTPPEAAGMADRASRGWDSNSVYPAAELALSVLPHAAALNPNEIQRAILQCKEQSDLMLERACVTVENAAKGGGVYPEVLFQVARYWHELYLRNTPNSEHEAHEVDDHHHSSAAVSLSALIESHQHHELQQQQQQQQHQQHQQQMQVSAQAAPLGMGMLVPPPMQATPQAAGLAGPPIAQGQPGQVVVTAGAPQSFQQGVVPAMAPMALPPYPAPYSFCQNIYHPHPHNIAPYTNNHQLQMYVSPGPAPPPQPYPGYHHAGVGPQQPNAQVGQPGNNAYVQQMQPPQQMPPPQAAAAAAAAAYQQALQCAVAGRPPPYPTGPSGPPMPPQNMQQVVAASYYGQGPPPQPPNPNAHHQQPPPQPPNNQAAMSQAQNVYASYAPPPMQNPTVSHVHGPPPPQPPGRQRHPHQFTPTQLRYLLAAYNVGMLAMETLARRVHDDRPQAKYARNPPYGEDVKWLLRISKKLGTQYLHQFCICAVNSIVSPFVLHDVAIDAAHYLGRNNQQLIMQHLRSALTPLVQKCQQMYIQCIHQKLYHLTQADYEEFASIILAARAAFIITPEGNAQFKDWLQSIKRSKSCKKELWTQINAALQSNSK